MTRCARVFCRLPPLGQVLSQPPLRGGLPRGLDRGRGVPLLGEAAQVALLAAVAEPRQPLLVALVPGDAGEAAGAGAGEGSGQLYSCEAG